MLNLFANSLVLAGAAIMVASLLPVRRLVTQLPAGLVRRRWLVLAALILAFILGYLSYAGIFWNRPADWPNLIVPIIFFFGAWFVWLVSTLSWQTVIDVRRVSRLEQESITDALTGLYNRRYLDRRLDEEFARAQRYALPLAVLLLDIDHFKRVNDSYGHQTGDQVLSDLGKLALSTARNTDIAARYGGEEFLVIAPNTPAASAEVLAERLRKIVASHTLSVAGGASQPVALEVTVSVGVADLGRGINSPQELVRRADEALYRAKQAGRNRVVVTPASTEKASP